MTLQEKALYFQYVDQFVRVHIKCNRTLRIYSMELSCTVKATFGETILLGGMHSRTNTRDKTGFPFLQDVPGLQYFFSKEQTTSSTTNTLYLLTPRRGGSVGQTLETLSKRGVQGTLQQRGLMAVGEYSSLHYILKYLAGTPLFSNFRSGDLMPPSWGQPHSDINKKIDQLAAFLYF